MGKFQGIGIALLHHSLWAIISMLCFLPLTGFPGSDGKESAYNVRDLGLILVLGRSPREGHGFWVLQYSYLENSIGREAWQATVHEVTKSLTRLSDLHNNHLMVSLTTKYEIMLPKVGPSCLPLKDIKEAKMVEKKVCFISCASSQRGGWTSVQSLTLFH